MSPETLEGHADGGHLEYALTRVHARHGMRPAETDWARLEASRDLVSYLDQARAGPLAAWVATLGVAVDGHTIERSLRGEWRGYVQEVAGWHPCRWQPWLTWLAWLPWLALLAQLARAEVPPLWLLADPVCGPVAPGTHSERRAALERTALAPLAAGFDGGDSFAALWRRHWQALAPRSDTDTQRLQSSLLATLDRYAGALARSAESSAPRNELAFRLARLFRTAGGTAIATACHLALTALDLQRLRGGLAYRSLAGGAL